VLEGFCDANCISNNDEVSSTSGYVFTLGGRAIWWKSTIDGGAITWKFTKQTCVACSTMEAEFTTLE